MAVIRPEKAAKVAELKELLVNSKCSILVDCCSRYRTAPQNA